MPISMAVINKAEDEPRRKNTGALLLGMGDGHLLGHTLEWFLGKLEVESSYDPVIPALSNIQKIENT